MIASLGVSAQLQDPTYVGYNCSNSPSTNDTYLSNIKSLLTSFSNGHDSLFAEGYHYLVKGQNASMVFGMFLCRGDLSPEVCRDCVMFASNNTQSRCPRRKELLVQYDECMLGYSDRNIFMDNVRTRSTPTIITWNTQEIPVYRLDRFKDDMLFMMNESAEEAANSREKRMAVYKSSSTSSETLYALQSWRKSSVPEL
ncbi:hypothetical protein Bca52824_093000 [Brassica carinata]|uniref:Gnk2-homologous domain-containing protein n=1 Tax=Brassica carinata TaxID=52824 RepID=A0A8X7P5W6_BRACI|nr:hypothetical protein Bca52824_093000 [Brassica carinata]